MTAPALPEILLVEDDPGDAGLVQVALRRSTRPCRLRHVRDAAAAIEALSGNEPLPDLVLLDLSLPGRDGHELLRTIRTDPRLSLLPVVIVSTSGAEEEVRRAYAAGANAFVVKPMEVAAFVAAIHLLQDFWLGLARRPGLR